MEAGHGGALVPEGDAPIPSLIANINPSQALIERRDRTVGGARGDDGQRIICFEANERVLVDERFRRSKIDSCRFRI